MNYVPLPAISKQYKNCSVATGGDCLRVLLLLAALVLLPAKPCFAVLANAWHIPDNNNDLGFHMRNPEFEIGPSSSVTIYSGLQKFNNSFGTANQTGGTLYY